MVWHQLPVWGSADTLQARVPHTLFKFHVNTIFVTRCHRMLKGNSFAIFCLYFTSSSFVTYEKGVSTPLSFTWALS